MKPEDILKSLSSNLIHSPSPFFDRAQDFPLSDWMLSYALDEGTEDFEEFHLGGLPDLSEFFDRSSLSTTVDLQKILKLAESRKTLFFKYFKKYMTGRVLVDLGAGISNVSLAPRILAEIAGGTGYLAVDLQHGENILKRNEFSQGSTFWSLFLKGDNIQFLKSLNKEEGLCFLLSGLELQDMESADGKNYCEELLELIVERMDRKSLLILCVSSRDFAPSDFGLKLIYSDPHHEFFVKKAFFF